MKAKSLAAALAVGFFGVAFARNGTLTKLVRQGGVFATTGTSGFAKISRRI